VDTKNSSFLLRFLFDMFWLFFGHSPSVSSLLFDLSLQCKGTLREAPVS